jgi:hypothetical protein
MAPCVSILLSAALLVCPMLCAAGRCCEHSALQSEAEPPSCCHKHDGTCDKDSRPAQRPESDSNRGSQCICHGAVVDHAPRQIVELDVRWDLPTVVMPAVAVASARPFSVAHEWLQPDIGESPGRVVCILFSTMQC